MGRKKQYENTAARVAAYRERNNLKTFTVQLDEDLFAQLEAYLEFKTLTKSQVIEKLIKNQLLRKR